MAYDPQLEWIAAVNGMSPDEYIASQQAYQQQKAQEDAFNAQRRAGLEKYWAENPPSTSNTGTEFLIENPRTPEEIARANQTVTNQLTGREYGSFADVADARQASSDRTQQTLGQTRDTLSQGAASDAAARASNNANLGTAFNNATAGNAAIIQGRYGQTAARNAASQDAINALGRSYEQSGAMDASTVGALQDRYDSYGILQGSGPYQNISSDPGLVAQQQAGYDAFSNWAAGGGDISSDPRLVQQQQDVYGGLMGFANGENDISSDPGLVAMQQGVYDDYGQFASGAMDLTSQAATAQADAEALAAQKEALGEFRDRMDPKLTDAERFLYMQSRLSQEQSQRAARDANYRELERRGMGGSTMALSNLNASSAEASNTRALQDLGANAKAVDRAEKALVNYGNMSSTIADQSFQRDFATKSAADAMAINNNKQRLAGIQGQGQMATEMRNADDEMKQFNSSQRLSGLQSAGVVAGQMRTADDNIRMSNQEMRMRGTEGMARQANEMRSADDAMRTFNKEQEMIQTRHMDDFAAQQQRDAWTRDTGMADARFRQTEANDRRADSLAGRTETSTQNQWERTSADANAGMTANRDYLEGYDRVVGRSNESLRDNAADRRAGAEFDLGSQRLKQEGDNAAISTREKALESANEDRRAREAETAAQRRQADQQEFDSSFSQVGLLGYLGL